MPRASLSVGHFVQLGKGGQPLARYHGITADLVMRIEAIIPRAVYGRKAFAVRCGDKNIVAWPSQVRLVQHPPGKKKARRAP